MITEEFGSGFSISVYWCENSYDISVLNQFWPQQTHCLKILLDCLRVLRTLKGERHEYLYEIMYVEFG